jgi:hypothetical protein
LDFAEPTETIDTTTPLQKLICDNRGFVLDDDDYDGDGEMVGQKNNFRL